MFVASVILKMQRPAWGLILYEPFASPNFNVSHNRRAQKQLPNAKSSTLSFHLTRNLNQKLGTLKTMVNTTEAITYAELCVYVPIFFLTLIIIFRHGFQRQLGWIYLVIFCLIRCAGAGFKIASEHHPSNKTDIEWSSILQSVGLSPLLMASLGLLKRV